MLLTITSTAFPATDLGYLLHKNPARIQKFEMKFGKVHVFYPEATQEKCTAALLLDIDPVGLVRGQRATLDQHVNDRPYVASSFMSVAVTPYPLDEQYQDWGASEYFRVSLTAMVRLRDLLTHLYVLLPVLDDEKHYWVGDDEVEKLLRHGQGWLVQHPERELITRRYLRHKRLVRAALAQLAEELVRPLSYQFLSTSLKLIKSRKYL